jgi:transcriptional regulator with XRE-family HTH domain
MPSSVTTSLLNSQLLKERRLQLNLPTRELGRLSGMSGPTIQRIEAGESAPDLTLGDLHRLASALGLQLWEVLDARSTTERPETLDDVRVEALLANAGRLIRREEIATAFQWDLERVSNALTTLAARLDGTGQRLHVRTAGDVAIQPAPVGLTSSERERATRAAYQHRGINRRSAGVLAPLISARQMSVPTTNSDRVGAGELAAAGLAHIDGDQILLSDECAYSLMLD